MHELRCRHCRAVLGQTTNTRLVVASIVLTVRVYVQCACCGKGYVWRPLPEPAAVTSRTTVLHGEAISTQ